MEVATKALELRREQHCVSPVDLLGSVSPAPRCATDCSMGSCDLVQGRCTNRSPVAIGNRGHGPTSELGKSGSDSLRVSSASHVVPASPSSLAGILPRCQVHRNGRKTTSLAGSDRTVQPHCQFTFLLLWQPIASKSGKCVQVAWHCGAGAPAYNSEA